MKSVALVVSIIINILLGGLLLLSALDGCAEISRGKVGVLTSDIRVGVFDSGQALFTLPRGLVVRDVSATGADRFEPHRFRLVITSDRKLVDYSGSTPQANPHAELYSADIGLRSGEP